MFLSPDELKYRLTQRPPVEISEPIPRWAAVGAILRHAEPGWELLLIKRAVNERDPWSGHMAFPGGRVDASDQSPLETALREVREEIGLDLQDHASLIGRLDDMQAMARGLRLPMAIRPFVFLLHRLPPLAPDVREVDEVVWVPVQSLLDPQNNSTFIYHYQDTPIELPCVRFKQYTIWGLTYHMLRELLSRLCAEQAQP